MYNTLTTEDLKRKIGRPKQENKPARQMTCFLLRKDVLLELNKLTDLFNKKTMMHFSRTKMLEAIILNEVKNFDFDKIVKEQLS